VVEEFVDVISGQKVDTAQLEPSMGSLMLLCSHPFALSTADIQRFKGIAFPFARQLTEAKARAKTAGDMEKRSNKFLVLREILTQFSNKKVVLLVFNSEVNLV
jgi:hypothetical protein